jgi:hypothetical protein
MHYSQLMGPRHSVHTVWDPSAGSSADHENINYINAHPGTAQDPEFYEILLILWTSRKILLGMTKHLHAAQRVSETNEQVKKCAPEDGLIKDRKM